MPNTQTSDAEPFRLTVLGQQPDHGLYRPCRRVSSATGQLAADGADPKNG